MLEARKHMAWYIKGVSGGAVLREAVNKATTPQEIKEIINQFAMRN